MGNILKISSDCSGVGAFPQALKRLGVNYEEQFACDFDFYARQTYLLNFGTKEDVDLGNTKEHKYYADLVKAFSLGKKVSDKEQELLSEANEFAKKFSFYYPFSMYQREIPGDSSDIYVGSFPCQSFSLAGKRLGQEDKRGVLFYNGHEFILKNKPRYFIIENVKGLLSDDSGKTFQRWIDFLGGKSVNGNPVIFPADEAVPYHVYYQVLNAKNYGIPQNRERVFIIGIRDDADNDFSFPKPFPLAKGLKDVLETEVDEKYFLSDKMVKVLTHHKNKIIENDNPKQSGTIHANYFKMGGRDQQYIKETESEIKILGYTRDAKGKVVSRHEQELSNTIHTSTGSGGNTDQFVLINSATKSGYEIATPEDSINFSIPNSETRRGRVGKGVAQTLDTVCNQGVMIGAIRGRNPSNPLSRVSGLPTEQMLEINENGTSNALTTVQKDNVVILHNLHGGFGETEPRVFTEYSPTIRTASGGGHIPSVMRSQRIRRLTEFECFKLMDFNFEIPNVPNFIWNVSATQAYRQAGNSIVVNVLCEIIKKLKL